jgi:hypothetical protein
MNNRRTPLPTSIRIARLTLVAALLCAAQAHAAVRAGESTADAVSAGTTPELVLFVWDPVKEVSYAKDLGINVYKEFYAAGDASTNLFVYGQQDTRYQKLFDPLNSDPNFQGFLAKSTDAANQIWGVIAISLNSDLALQQYGASTYMTLKHASPTGTLDPEYTNLMSMNNGDLADAVGTLGSNFQRLNTQAGSCSGTCATDYATNSSYLNVKGQLAYAGSIFRTDHTLPSAAAGAPNIFNPVNHSSWFYATTATSDNSTDTIAVDEFDNLAHDAYWGLGVDSSGNYILSYTLEAAMAAPQTAAGALLRLRTDYAAAYGHARLINAPGDPFSGVSSGIGAGTVTTVPEPASWGLMGLGLAVVAAAAGRRSRRA